MIMTLIEKKLGLDHEPTIPFGRNDDQDHILFDVSYGCPGLPNAKPH